MHVGWRPGTRNSAWLEHQWHADVTLPGCFFALCRIMMDAGRVGDFLTSSLPALLQVGIQESLQEVCFSGITTSMRPLTVQGSSGSHLLRRLTAPPRSLLTLAHLARCGLVRLQPQKLTAGRDVAGASDPKTPSSSSEPPFPDSQIKGFSIGDGRGLR